MPEGDTIYRTAVRLRAVMEGKRIKAVRGRDPALDTATLSGEEVTEIEARGKHLLIHTSSEQTIHSHMGMTGSWHLYQQGQTWQKPEKWAALVLEMQLSGQTTNRTGFDRDFAIGCRLLQPENTRVAIGHRPATPPVSGSLGPRYPGYSFRAVGDGSKIPLT